MKKDMQICHMQSKTVQTTTSIRYAISCAFLVKCVVRDCLFSIDGYYRKNWQTYVNTQRHQECNKHK